MIISKCGIIVQQYTNSQTPQSVTRSRVEEVRSEVDELKGIMVHNIGSLV